LAAYRCGTLGRLPSVSECRADLINGLGDPLGVEAPPTLAVGNSDIEVPVTAFNVGDVTYRLWRHPELYITPSLRMWVQEYDYAGNNYSLVPYLDRHPCWIECKNILENMQEAISG